MHLALNLGTSYKTGLFVVLHDFMFDRIMCFSENYGQGTPCDFYHTVRESHSRSFLVNAHISIIENKKIKDKK